MEHLKHKIYGIAGNSITLDLALIQEDAQGNEIPAADLVGATAVMQIRKSVTTDELTYEAIGSINTTEGTVKFTIPPVVSETLLEDKENKKAYVFGCRITYSDNSAYTILGGQLIVEQGVVR